MKRIFEGIVRSTNMLKTVVVEVASVKAHPKYHKRYAVTKRYKVHDEKQTAKVGDTVRFIECRPISKEKRWKLLS